MSKLLIAAVIAGTAWAQTELLRNGGAESDLSSWTVDGNASVQSYGNAAWPSPASRGAKYFAAENGRVLLSQEVAVSGGMKFVASGYMNNAEMLLRFYDAQARYLYGVSLGTIRFANRGLLRQERMGQVPAGAVRVRVELTLEPEGGADNLSVAVSTLLEAPGNVYFQNLIVNPGAENGPVGVGAEVAADVPGWARAHGASVAAYSGGSWIGPNDPGPANRGTKLFHGGPAESGFYQHIDVSAAARWIDAGQVRFKLSGWFGGAGNSAPSSLLRCEFYDWNGDNNLHEVRLGPVATERAALGQRTADGLLPAGTRKVLISVQMSSPGSIADALDFEISGPGGPPQIAADGVRGAGAFGGGAAAPGTWIEIFGANLSQSTRAWVEADFVNNTAPRSLDGVSVLVGGRPAFVGYVSPTQVNALLPADVPLGTQSVIVRNAIGEGGGSVVSVNANAAGILAPAQFRLSGQQYIGALFDDGKTWAMARGAVAGIDSRPATPGDRLTTFGVGLGPVISGLQPGVVPSGPQSIINQLQIYLANVPASVSYAGLAPGFVGLYQINFTVPTLPQVSAGMVVPLEFRLSGTRLAQNLVIAVSN
jgi:uncharacterized protein (TIGR03437 family)